MRTVSEWVGSSPDAMPPPRVRLRIFERNKGVCHLSGRRIGPGDKWHLDHIIAICNGGLNVESNMAPALVAPHKDKTRADRRLKAKNDRVRKKHLGLKKPRKITRWRRFDGSIRDAGRER